MDFANLLWGKWTGKKNVISYFRGSSCLLQRKFSVCTNQHIVVANNNPQGTLLEDQKLWGRKKKDLLDPLRTGYLLQNNHLSWWPMGYEKAYTYSYNIENNGLRSPLLHHWLNCCDLIECSECSRCSWGWGQVSLREQMKLGVITVLLQA